jgi:molybdopterin molybdotransferase
MAEPGLISVAEALARVLAGREALAPVMLPVRDALGLVAAETVLAPGPVPARPIAQRGGIAVFSADLIGASPYAPALLVASPTQVAAGETLPAGTDAILPADAASYLGELVEISQPAYPGENITLAGSDLAQGGAFIRAGERITRAAVLALDVAGISRIAVRRPDFRILLPAGKGGETAESHWLRLSLQALGCVSSTGAEVDIALAIADDMAADPPSVGLALRPGAWVGRLGEQRHHPAIILPARFDGMVAMVHALIVPLIARLTGQAVRVETRTLTRKIASTIGFSDVALLSRSGEGYEPLAVGQVTLAALLAADAIVLLPPESEGAAAGAPLAAIPIHDPLGPIRA